MKVLIVGQGLAGTLLGYRLERAGVAVHYIDAPEQTAASTVAAGIINPITGRRFVKSWRIGELLPEAEALYGELERMLGVQLWFPLPLIRTLYNRGDRNDWEARGGDPGYATFLDDNPDPGRIPDITRPVFGYAGVRHAGRVAVSALVGAYRKRLCAEGRLLERELDWSDLPAVFGDVDNNTAGVVAERSRSTGAGERPKAAGAWAADGPFDYVVSCEGWRARHNPWFAHLPHGGNKGEVLIVRTEAPPLERMFKHRVFLVPLADGTYWVGATSENQFDDDAPTAANRTFLRDRLEEILEVPYEIVAHRAAVRPTVRDRRMFLGTHPEEPRLAILNGLGTKGASLAPLGSRWLAEHLLDRTPLPGEVDILRFG